MLWLHAWTVCAHVTPNRLRLLRIIDECHGEMNACFSKARCYGEERSLSRSFYGSWRLLGGANHGGATPQRYMSSETNVTSTADTEWKDRSRAYFIVTGLRHPMEYDALAVF
jgi:hypothetical protein